MEKQITIHEFIQYIKRYWLRAVIYIICGCALFVGLGVWQGKSYTSQTQTTLYFYETSNGARLHKMGDCRKLMTSKYVINPTVTKLNKTYHYALTKESLKRAIRLKQNRQLNQLTIEAKAKTPQEAKNIANAITHTFKAKAKAMKGLKYVAINQAATMNQQKASPTLLKLALIGAFVGAALFILWLLLRLNKNDVIQNKGRLIYTMHMKVIGEVVHKEEGEETDEH